MFVAAALNDPTTAAGGPSVGRTEALTNPWRDTDAPGLVAGWLAGLNKQDPCLAQYLVFMRTLVSKACTGFIGAGFGAWIAGYAATGNVNPWPTPWLWVLVGVVFVAIVAWIFAEIPKRMKPGAADFLLRPRGGALWELERVGAVIAFAVGQGDGVVSGSHFARGAGIGHGNLGDFQPGQRQPVTMPNDSGCWVWFDWIADGSRMYTKSLYVATGGEDLTFFGVAGHPNKPFQT